jgi:hypothetical protein
MGGIQKKLMRSFVVKYKSTNGNPLLGGLVKAKSARWGRMTDAEDYLREILRENADTNPTGKIVTVDRPPEIFPHCVGAPSQAIGARCVVCERIITPTDAVKFGDPENSRKITGQKRGIAR